MLLFLCFHKTSATEVSPEYHLNIPQSLKTFRLSAEASPGDKTLLEILQTLKFIAVYDTGERFEYSASLISENGRHSIYDAVPIPLNAKDIKVLIKYGDIEELARTQTARNPVFIPLQTKKETLLAIRVYLDYNLSSSIPVRGSIGFKYGVPTQKIKLPQKEITNPLIQSFSTTQRQLFDTIYKELEKKYSKIDNLGYSPNLDQSDPSSTQSLGSLLRRSMNRNTYYSENLSYDEDNKPMDINTDDMSSTFRFMFIDEFFQVYANKQNQTMRNLEQQDKEKILNYLTHRDIINRVEYEEFKKRLLGSK